MPAQIGSLFVSLTANVAPFQQSMGRAQTVTAQTAQNIRRSTGVAEASVNRFWGSASNTKFRPYSLIAVSRAFDNAADRAGLLRGAILATSGVFGGFAAALSSNLILRYADSFTNLTNQLRVVSKDSGDLVSRFSALEEVSRRSRSSLEATAILYSRIQKAAPTRSVDEVIKFTETIQKALVLGGATAQEARSAAIQFSQGIASNRLGGEELRAVLETPLGLELAKGLGVTIGKFREMGYAGELTAGVILGALDKISDRIDNQFSKSVLTLDQALIQVDNQLTSYIGNVNKAYGGTGLLAKGVLAFGDNLETIVPILGNIGLAISSVFVGRNKAIVGGLAGGAAGAFLGNQLGGLGGAVLGALGGGFLGSRGPGAADSFRKDFKAAGDAVDQLTKRVGDLKKEFAATAAARRAALTASQGDPFGAASPKMMSNLARVSLDPSAGFGQLYKARDDAAADGQRRLGEAVQKTAIAYRAATVEYRAASTELGALAKSATLAGQAKQFLGRQLTSIVGLFGGPWGLAISAGIAGLSLLAVNAQRRAQEFAAGMDLIREKIGSLSDSGDAGARQSILGDRIKHGEEDLKRIANVAKVTIDQVKQVGENTATTFTELFQGGVDIRRRVQETVQSLADGKIGVEEFRSQLAAIDREAGPAFDALIQKAKESEKVLSDGALATRLAVDELGKLKDLARQPISIRFNVAFEGLAGNEARFPGAGAFGAFSAERDSNTRAVVSDLNAKIAVARLMSKGLTAEAEVQKILNTERQAGRAVDEDAVRAKVELLTKLEAEAAGLKKAGTAADGLREKIARLGAEAKGAFLNDLDRGIVEQARGLKVAAKDIEAYINAAKSGDFSGAPPMLVELRGWEIYARAAESARDLVQEYGNWSQIAPLAQQKQQELDIAVANGAITAQQAKIAYADYLSSFENMRWIDETARAFGDFVMSGLDGFDSLADGAESFLKSIRNLIVELFVVEPLIRNLKAAMSGGEGIFGLIKGLFGAGQSVASGAPMNLLPAIARHGGGPVDGSRGFPRAFPSAMAARAPRFHGGLGANEFLSVLEKGETVLTDRMTSNAASTIAGLAATGGGPTINVYEAPGTKAEVRQGSNGDIDVVIRQLEGAMAKSIAGNGPVGKAISGTFAVQRRKR